jgi:uncharacterized protein (TIGR03382 family)
MTRARKSGRARLWMGIVAAALLSCDAASTDDAVDSADPAALADPVAADVTADLAEPTLDGGCSCPDDGNACTETACAPDGTCLVIKVEDCTACGDGLSCVNGTCVVDQAAVTFETGRPPWFHGGEVPWSISNLDAYLGAFTLGSGAIADSQSSTVSATVQLAEPGLVGFWVRVGSEAGFDFLRFSIDGGAPLYEASGLVDWEYQQFAVPAGRHTLTWSYSKDGSVARNGDRAFLDEVSLPGDEPRCLGCTVPEQCDDERACTVDVCEPGGACRNDPEPSTGRDVHCDSIDEDCDSRIDENFVPGDEATCGVGACQRTGHVIACDLGIPVDDCVPGAPAPSDATCDNVDDDCSGAPDEDFPATPTSCGIGACVRSGVATCTGGVVGDTCAPGAPAPSDATCDAIDDDCSGQADEDFAAAPTTCGVGACAAVGETTCAGGVVGDTCTPGAPTADTDCDGVDDDCDGLVDDDFAGAETQCGVGACAATGRTSCVGGVIVDSCVPGAPSADDTQCDGVDNDCSGEVDEDFAETSTSCGNGACAATGTLSCQDGQVVDSCVPTAPPAPEDGVCDGVDNDCSGEVDEDFRPTRTTCGEGRCERTGRTSCLDGAVVDSCEVPPDCDPDDPGGCSTGGGSAGALPLLLLGLLALRRRRA